MRTLSGIIFYLCCFYFSSAQTSVYHPFPDSNAIWREEKVSTDGLMGMYQWKAEKFISGDTVIGAFTYHKIYESGLWSHCYYVPFCFIPDTSAYYYDYLVGFIRQDSNKRIYMYDFYQQQIDTLLYDFNLQVGDTIPDSYNHQPASVNPITVGSIDSVFDGVNYRKHFILSGAGGPASLIEGIGSTGGLFLELDVYQYEHGGTLHCFMQNDSVKYSDSTVDACVIINNVNNDAASDFEFYISPNPSTSQFSINSNYYTLNLIQIYNVQGEEIYSSAAHCASCPPSPNGYGGQSIVHCASFRPGIYFVKATSGDKIFFQKFIKE